VKVTIQLASLILAVKHNLCYWMSNKPRIRVEQFKIWSPARRGPNTTTNWLTDRRSQYNLNSNSSYGLLQRTILTFTWREENHENPQSGHLTYWQRFEPSAPAFKSEVPALKPIFLVRYEINKSCMSGETYPALTNKSIYEWLHINLKSTFCPEVRITTTSVQHYLRYTLFYQLIICWPEI
jgi:hypothetical protein